MRGTVAKRLRKRAYIFSTMPQFEKFMNLSEKTKTDLKFFKKGKEIIELRGIFYKRHRTGVRLIYHNLKQIHNILYN